MLGVAHSTVFIDHDFYPASKRLAFGAFERPHIILLRATPPYRIVYLSGIVPLDDRTIAIEAQRPANESDVVMGEGLELLGSHFIEYPAGVVVESADSCLISQHYNDQRPVTLRATGLKPIFDEVIASDLALEASQNQEQNYEEPVAPGVFDNFVRR